MAVYTEVSDEALRAFLADYALGELLAFRGIAEGVENSNYALKTEAGDFILTLYEKRVDPAELPYFLGLMDHIVARLGKGPQSRQRDQLATVLTASIGPNRELAERMLHFGQLILQVQLFLVRERPGFDLHAGVCLIAFEVETRVIAQLAPHVFRVAQRADLGFQALFMLEQLLL